MLKPSWYIRKVRCWSKYSHITHEADKYPFFFKVLFLVIFPQILVSQLYLASPTRFGNYNQGNKLKILFLVLRVCEFSLLSFNHLSTSENRQLICLLLYAVTSQYVHAHTFDDSLPYPVSLGKIPFLTPKRICLMSAHPKNNSQPYTA